MNRQIYIHYGATKFDPLLGFPIKNEYCWVKPKGGLWASRKTPRLVGRIGVPEKSLENVRKTVLLNLLSKMKAVLQLLVQYSSFVGFPVLKIRDLLLLILLILKNVYVSESMLSSFAGTGRSLQM